MKSGALICFAVKEEASSFLQTSMAKRERVLITGMGRGNAEKSLREALHKELPKLVLTCGFAGGLNLDLKLGDVVFDFSPSSRGDEAQIEIGNRQSAIGDQSETPRVVSCEKLIAAGAKPVKFFCADRIATDVIEKKKLRDETHADAVEMESATIHAVCRERGIPCVTIRVISDTANEDLPLDFNQLVTPDYKIDFRKLAFATVRKPWKIPALVQLQKKTKIAAENLSRVLQSLPV